MVLTEGKAPTPALRRGSGVGGMTLALGSHLPPRAPRQKTSVRNPEPGDYQESTTWHGEQRHIPVRETDD